MDHKLVPIAARDAFCFSCAPDVPCFNECCRDLNQFLTPYDVLRLKNHFGQSSREFLERYTSQHLGPESGLPIVTLRPINTSELTCPFVSEKGCKVYKNRPSSCRTYPLVRAVARSRQTGEMNEQFVVLKEPHCHGFDELKTQTVRQWIDRQGIAIYNEINDKLMDIISIKNRLMPGPLHAKTRQLFYMALYDLDNFRSQMAKSAPLDNLKVDAVTIERAMDDDVALLELGMKWVEEVLFNR